MLIYNFVHNRYRSERNMEHYKGENEKTNGQTQHGIMHKKLHFKVFQWRMLNSLKSKKKNVLIIDK